MRFSAAFLLAFAASASAFDVPSLTPENYDEMTDGKTVFLKFFAPWVRNISDDQNDRFFLLYGGLRRIPSEVKCEGLEHFEHKLLLLEETL